MHPALPRTAPAPATRSGRPAAAHRALRAVPDKPVVHVPTRLRDALRALWGRIDFAGLALVAKAGVGASLVFTVVLLLWLASAGRLG